MRVSLIRHGVAKYEKIEKTRDRNSAQDLDPLKIFSLKAHAAAFVAKIDSKDSVTIWSSPLPRSLETSRIFEEEVLKAGITIRKISIFDAFEEARGFKWEHLNGLVNGIPVIINGVSIPVPIQLTNPAKLSVGEYFRHSSWMGLSQETLQSLGDFGLLVQAMEPYENIVKRVTQTLARLKKLSNKHHHLLIFTHQCCTDFVIETVNNYKNGGISPGEAVTLMIEGNKIMIEDTPFGNGDFSEILGTQIQNQVRDTLNINQ